MKFYLFLMMLVLRALKDEGWGVEGGGMGNSTFHFPFFLERVVEPSSNILIYLPQDL